jgi:hypothetical protein
LLASAPRQKDGRGNWFRRLGCSRVQSHGQERKVFVRSHPKIVWSANRGHLSFTAQENLLWGLRRLFLDFSYPLRPFGDGF